MLRNEEDMQPSENEPTYNLVLKSIVGSKIQAIKELRLLYYIDLKDAKTLVDNMPIVLKHCVSNREAEYVRAALEPKGIAIAIEPSGR
jgi:ribosomal protein L7/L12